MTDPTKVERLEGDRLAQDYAVGPMVSADYAAKAVLAEQQRCAEAIQLAQDRQIEINTWRGCLAQAEQALRELVEAVDALIAAPDAEWGEDYGNALQEVEAALSKARAARWHRTQNGFATRLGKQGGRG